MRNSYDSLSSGGGELGVERVAMLVHVRRDELDVLVPLPRPPSATSFRAVSFVESGRRIFAE